MSRVGEELVQAGWRQGSIASLGISFAPYLERGEAGWEVGAEPLDGTDMFVVVSQSCDIERDPSTEPYVEVMRAFWTQNEDLIRMARGHSWRYFCLRTRESDGALVADAPRTVRITKESLRGIAPEHNLDPANGEHFRSWIAARYARVALEREVIDGIQRPIVDAVQRRKKDERIGRAIDSLDEVRLFWHEEREIELFLIPNYGGAVVLSDVAALAGVMVDALEKVGYVTGVDWNVHSLEDLSADEYLNSVHVPLDQYSIPEPALDTVEGEQRRSSDEQAASD